MKLVEYVKRYALYIAFIQAWVATLGSLYYSEVRGLPPCLLCWYQRIFMYPLAILFAVAIIRKERIIAYYALPLAVIGAVIAFYHYLLQMTSLAQITPVSCSALTPCEEKQILYLGFITIPLLSLMAFLVIIISMLAVLKDTKK